MNRKILIAFCTVAVMLCLCSPTQAGSLRKLLSRLRPSGSCAAACSSCAAPAKSAGPAFRKECNGNSCRLVPVK